MKGFTLIEILAVIVILAIILLISVPMINGIIGAVKRSAFETSVGMIVRSAELDIMSPNSSYANGATVTYVDGVAVGTDLPYSGERPQSGTININTKGEVELALYDGEYCATKTYSTKKINTFKSTEEECVIDGNPVFTKIDSGPNYSLLLDDKKNLYFNYEVGAPSLLNAEIALSGGQSQEPAFTTEIMLLHKLLFLSAYAFPDDIAGIDVLVNSNSFKNVVYYMYTYNESEILNAIEEGTINPALFSTDNSSINAEYESDPALVSKLNTLKISFKNFFKEEANVEGISTLVFNVYQMLQEDRPSSGPSMTAFLQNFLPITAYIAYVNDDSLIGFNFLNYSIANFENDVKLKEDIASVIEEQEYLDLVMDIYYNLTGGSFKFPPSYSEFDRSAYILINQIFGNILSTDLAMTSTLINGTDFKNGVYYIFTYGNDGFWSSNGNDTQVTIDNAYATLPELTSFYNSLKLRTDEILNIDNSANSLAKVLKVVFIDDYYYYLEDLGGTLDNFLADEYVMDYIAAAFVATDNNWYARSFYSLDSSYDFYINNKTNYLFIQYLESLKTELNSILDFTAPQTPEERLQAKLNTLVADAKLYFSNYRNFRYSDEINNFIKDNIYLTEVYYIYSNLEWDPQLDYQDYEDISVDETVLNDTFFKEYFDKFTLQFKSSLDFKEISSITVKSNYTDVKDIYVFEEMSFIIHDNGDVSVIGFYGDYNYDLFTKLDNVTDVKSIVSVYEELYFVRNDGQVYSSGSVYLGSIGIGNNISSDLPVLIPGLTNVKKIVSYDFAKFALLNDGTIKMWGNFGLPKGYYSTSYNIIIGNPIVMPNISNVKDIAFYDDGSDDRAIIIDNNNVISIISRNVNYLWMSAYSNLFTTPMVHEGSSEVVSPSAVFEYPGGVVVKGSNSYYAYNSNLNTIMNGPYAPNYDLYWFDDLGIQNIRNLYVNESSVVYIDNNDDGYYTGLNIANTFGLETDLIDQDDNEWILDFKKITATKIKLYDFVDVGNFNSCSGDVHTIITPSNIVKRYGLYSCDSGPV